ncbi:allophanate hydrolase, partial [Mesorhizobium sp. M7A.F.Ca.CA.001.09.2.1]
HLRFSPVSIEASTEVLRANRQQRRDFIAARNLMAGEQRAP